MRQGRGEFRREEANSGGKARRSVSDVFSFSCGQHVTYVLSFVPLINLMGQGYCQPILQMWKLRHGEVQSIAQDNKASKWGSQSSKLSGSRVHT